jgi:uncharacterized damage-inducible protein DinB
MENTVQAMETNHAIVITPEALLDHWQGHRRLTRKVIEAFPEDQFYHYSVGGMRPFSELAMEMIGLAIPGMRGVATGKWDATDGAEINSQSPAPGTRAEVLRLWDETTELINTLWAQIPPHRFQEIDAAFGKYAGPIYSIILYWIDNEIHHRGQGYVYLRSLGIQPPAFWDRGEWNIEAK